MTKRAVTVSLMAAMALLLALSPLDAGTKRYDVPVGDAPYIGPKDAGVTIIEFIDYQ